MSISQHLKEHAILNIDERKAFVDVAPTGLNLVASPIGGDPDTANQIDIGGIQHIVSGMLLPNKGSIAQIGMILQGNAGAGTSYNVRWSVIEIVKDASKGTGLAAGTTLASGLTAIADNVNGHVLLKDFVADTGTRLNVPTQFVLAVKAKNAATINVQNLKGAGAFPGVFGYLAGNDLIAAATYTFDTIDFSGNDPVEVPVGDGLTVTNFKGLAIYANWSGVQV